MSNVIVPVALGAGMILSNLPLQNAALHIRMDSWLTSRSNNSQLETKTSFLAILRDAQEQGTLLLGGELLLTSIFVRKFMRLFVVKGKNEFGLNLVSRFVVYPLDVLRHRLLFFGAKHQTTSDIAWSGFELILLTEATFRIVYNFTHNILFEITEPRYLSSITTQYWVPRWWDRRSNPWLGSVISLVATMLATVVVYPINTLRRRFVLDADYSYAEAFNDIYVSRKLLQYSVWSGVGVHILLVMGPTVSFLLGFRLGQTYSSSAAVQNADTAADDDDETNLTT